MKKLEQFTPKNEGSGNAFDIYCMRCGFDKRWPAHNCDHKPMSFLRRNVVRLTQPALVLDGLYNRRTP